MNGLAVVSIILGAVVHGKTGRNSRDAASLHRRLDVSRSWKGKRPRRVDLLSEEDK